MQLEPQTTYLTADGRKALCLGVTKDGRCAVAVDGRKMIETYGIDGTFRITSSRPEDEGLHIASKYVPPLTVWAVVTDAGTVAGIQLDATKFSDDTLAKGRLVELREVRA
jgi:hypothetical protein